MRQATPFAVYPAIDLIGGRAVRLQQGAYDAQLATDDDPLVRAELAWQAGATALHVIDLDAARCGERSPEHAVLLRSIAERRPPGAVLQVGGGLRDRAAVHELLDLGVDRVLIGTLAMREPASIAALVAEHGSAIAVAVDARDGTVRTDGWLADEGVGAVQAVHALAELGVKTFLVTAIDRDGTLSGLDLDLLGEVVGAVEDIQVIAAGGVADPSDVRAARACGCAGAVVGRAWLEQPDALPEFLTAGNDSQV